MDMTLEFPPYSPDLSPIENIWDWLKNEVTREMPALLVLSKLVWRKIGKNHSRILEAIL